MEHWNIGMLENPNFPIFPQKIFEFHGILENSTSSTISRGNIGILESWNIPYNIFRRHIGILEYWNPRKFQYKNIFIGNIGKLKYSIIPRKNPEIQRKHWNTVTLEDSKNIRILENSHFPIFTEEILEYFQRKD